MSEIVPLFSQLVSATQHCHEHSVAHLDLKLENVLVVDVRRRRTRSPAMPPHASSARARPPHRHSTRSGARSPPHLPSTPRRIRAASCSSTLGWRVASLSRRRCASATRPARPPTSRRYAAATPPPHRRSPPTPASQPRPRHSSPANENLVTRLAHTRRAKPPHRARHARLRVRRRCERRAKRAAAASSTASAPTSSRSASCSTRCWWGSTRGQTRTSPTPSSSVTR